MFQFSKRYTYSENENIPIFTKYVAFRFWHIYPVLFIFKVWSYGIYFGSSSSIF